MAVNGYPNEKILAVERWCSEHRALMVANLGAAENSVAVSITQRHWRKVFDSAAPQWRGSGSALPEEFDGGNDCQFSIAAHSVVLYLTEDVSWMICPAPIPRVLWMFGRGTRIRWAPPGTARVLIFRSFRKTPPRSSSVYSITRTEPAKFDCR